MIEILRIVGVFGIRGAVRVHSFSDDLKRYKFIYDSEGHAFSFRVVRFGIIEMEGVVDRNQAETLRGKSFFVKKNDLLPLKNDEFYIADLIGQHIPVCDSDAECKIVSVCNYGAGDIIELNYDGKQFLVPFTNSNFPELQGKLYLSLDAFNNFRG